ncbi:UDP-3-O-(3-hydroxymyristoyl)glucosamine N-acyltransferase [Actibacterium pelagium]|uniref:UDP-3-O-acylglucosamine N-acyltransferase n=1 Tax=Actibacterium pelagium TaxID=2029103 RepID=A0A917ACU9_9RHOB|nr:UDP-3-O-(3-hydroxymyristoyl)glucosamine N-acyltransferase [Actibacterium pelagium]GGE42101.1 UDP-3-O-(3-hydroxymyristoyl)glucosamine N-acyltransferase [Actibacterium pelagium]
MAYTLQQIADALGARVEGDAGLTVLRPAEPAEAGPNDLALAMSPKYAVGLTFGQAEAAILWDGADWQSLGLKGAIYVPRPRYAMSGLTQLMDAGPQIAPGIHPSAVVAPDAKIGENAAIGPFVVIASGVKIGANARIASHVSITDGAQIGDDALLLQGARIGAEVQIGDRFIAQPGAVIGADGFSFVTPEKSAVENVRETLGDAGDAEQQGWVRIHSIGSVEIGDDVEIGANTTIDRGTIRATRIGSGTKIDNLVQVGHNVQIGQDCLLCGQVGVAGSTRIGDNVVLGGQVGVVDNLIVGDAVIAGAGTMILSNVPKGRAMLGYPAMKMQSHVETYKALRRLPRLMSQVAKLQKAVSKSDQND